MALFEREGRASIQAGSRSNTKLIVSGGMSPAEKWVTDPTLSVLFQSNYATPAEKDVVISKGMIVTVGEHVTDDETGKKVNTITIADGAVAAKSNAIGMAPYNFSKHYNNFLYGNQPAIITRDYVELPLFLGSGAATNAASIKYGAAWHASSLKAGDYVKVSGVDNKGQLTKWIAGTDSAHLIVGQVLATDENQEPWGWLKWAMWDETARKMDNAITKNTAGYTDPITGGFPYDESGRYGEDARTFGFVGAPGYWNAFTTPNEVQGIAGLTDGGLKADTAYQAAQSVTITVAAGNYATSPVKINLEGTTSYWQDIVAGTVTVNDGSADLTEDTDFALDYTKGILTFKKNIASSKTLTVTFKAKFYGTPSGWNYNGAVGAARILLKL